MANAGLFLFKGEGLEAKKTRRVALHSLASSL